MVEMKLTRAERTKLSEEMQLSLIRDIVHVVAGEHAIKIVEILYKKKNVNEFTIADKLGLTINQSRNILYRLSDEGMVHFIRKKDTKNGGWYTYFWTMNVVKSLTRLKERLANHYADLKRELARRQSTQYYYSPSANIEYSEEKALEHDFIDPETGEVMELKDTSERVAHIQQALSDLDSKLTIIGGELSFILEKEDASKQRRQRAEQKKKDAERAEKRRLAAIKRKRAAKKKAPVIKKVVKKKAVKRKVARKKAPKRKLVRGKKPVRRKVTRRKVAAKRTVRRRVSVRRTVSRVKPRRRTVRRKAIKRASLRTKKAKKVVRRTIARKKTVRRRR